MFYVKCGTWAQAVELAAAMAHRQAAFYQDGGHWVVCWQGKPLKID